MPEPNPTAPGTSDRERLLRLIDGNPEVLSEPRQEVSLRLPAPVESVPPAEPVVPVQKAAEKAPEPIPAAQNPLSKIKIDLSNKDVVKLLKMVVAVVLVFVCLHYVSDMVKTISKNMASNLPKNGEGIAADDENGGLRLVGVDWDDSPVALLEDTRTGKTYFAKRNDRVKNAKVKEIEKNKVIISVNGKTVELK